jgi:hypothetical protein
VELKLGCRPGRLRLELKGTELCEGTLSDYGVRCGGAIESKAVAYLEVISESCFDYQRITPDNPNQESDARFIDTTSLLSRGEAGSIDNLGDEDLDFGDKTIEDFLNFLALSE